MADRHRGPSFSRLPTPNTVENMVSQPFRLQASSTRQPCGSRRALHSGSGSDSLALRTAPASHQTVPMLRPGSWYTLEVEADAFVLWRMSAIVCVTHR